MTELKLICPAFAFVLILLSGPVPSHAEAAPEGSQGKHLFILSGQSNMALFDPKRLFTPFVQEKFGKDAVIVVKDAKGGEPIRRWDKSWKGNLDLVVPPDQVNGDLYDRLMAVVLAEIAGQKIETVTFIWMQGESDAEQRLGDFYLESLKGLFDQLKNDLGRNDINFIIGRISDFGLDKPKSAEWIKVREAQVSVAESLPFSRWVDTDDLNDGMNVHKQEVKNDLHSVGAGFKTLGKRYAAAAIELIEEKNQKPSQTTENKP